MDDDDIQLDPGADIDQEDQAEDDAEDQQVLNNQPAPAAAPAPTPPPQAAPARFTPGQAVAVNFEHAAPTTGNNAYANGVTVNFEGGTPSPQEAAKKPISWGDYGRMAWQSTEAIGGQLLGAAGAATRALGSDPSVSQWIDTQRKSLSAHIAGEVSSMSPQAQEALRAKMFGSGSTDADGNYIPSIHDVGFENYLGATVASFAPDIALAVGSGELLAAKGVAAVFGLTQGGDAYNNLVDTIGKATPTQLQTSQVYTQLRQQGATDEQARQQMINKVALPYVAAQGAVGAAAGLGLGSLVTKGVFGAASRTLLKRVMLGAGEGAVTLGAQGGAGNALDQAANIATGTQKTYDPEQTALAVASGAVGGAVLGGVTGIPRHAGRAEAPAAEPEPEAPPENTENVSVPEFLNRLPPPPERQALTFNPDRTRGGTQETQPFQSTGTGMIPGEPATGFTTSPSEGGGVPTTQHEFRPPSPPGSMAPDVQAAVTEALAEPDQRPTLPQEQPTPAAEPQPVEPSPSPATDEAASQAVEPTPAQAEAGNYQKGHVNVQGMDVSIETPRGAIRKGPIDDTTGEPAWQAEMPNHYGYIKRTTGGDGEQIDVQLGPRTDELVGAKPDMAAAEPVFVVDQVDPQTGKFDEHKAFVGFHTQQEATDAYDASFSDGSGPSRRGAVSEMPFDKFKAWAQSGDTTKPLAYQRGSFLKRQAQKARMNPQAAPAHGEVFTAPETAEAAEPPGLMRLVKRADATRPRVNRMADEAREESANQPSRFELEPSAAVEEPGVEKPRSPQTTNKNRSLSDLLKKVINREMTPAEADEAYPRSSRVGGRQRLPENESFGAYVKAQIDRARDPEVAKDVVRRATELQENKTLPRQQKVAAARKLNDELGMSGPDHIAELERIRDELEDPVGAAAKKAEKQSTLLDKLKSKIAQGRALPMHVAESGVGKSLQNILERSHRAGRAAGIHSYLDAIANDPDIAERMPQAAALARRLKELLPGDMPVMSQEVATRRYGDGYTQPDNGGVFYSGRRVDGSSTGRPPMITINRKLPPASLVETVLHEGMHAVHDRYLDSIPDTHPDKQALSAIGDELSRYRDQLDPATQRILDYAMSNYHELHTMLMSNPRLQNLAAALRPSPEFQERMRSLGFPRQAMKSVWEGFSNWVRKVLNLPRISSSVLDWALRPATEIADRSAAYNREFPRDPVLNEAASTTADAVAHALPRFDKQTVKDFAADHIDPAGLGDKFRRAVLQGATTDGIYDWDKDLFESRDPQAPGNSLEDYREATESMAASSKKFRDDWADGVANILQRVPGPERDKLTSLLLDSTLAEAHPGNVDPRVNAHLVKPDQLRELAKLQARYKSLSPETQKTFTDIGDYFSKTYKLERAAQLTSLVKTVLPHATPAELKAVVDAAGTKASMDKFIDGVDNSPVFAKSAATTRQLVKAVAKLHSQGFVRGFYYPLRRFGDYVVHYGSKGTDDYGVEMFESRARAEARRDELNQAGAEPSQVLDRRDSRQRVELPSTLADSFDSALRKSPDFTADQAEAARDLFNNVALQYATRSATARARMRRQGVLGASKDTEKVIAQDFLSLASRMGYLEHGPDRVSAVSAMKRQVDWLGRNGAKGEQIRAQAVVHELEQRMPSGDDGSGPLAGLGRHMSQFGYVYSLMSPSHMLTSTMEAHSNSLSHIGARHGFARAQLAVAKALKDAAPILATGAKNTVKAMGVGLKSADWNLSHYVRDQFIARGANRDAMHALTNSLNNAGLIDHSFVREFQRVANPKFQITKGWWSKFLDANGAMAHAVDVMNKSAIAKAAYDLEFRRSQDVKTSVRYATDVARKSMPNYNIANKARISTDKGALGKLAGPMTQFKQYGIFMYSMMANLMKSSISGASASERAESRKALAAIFATHAMMAGAFTWIADPLRYIMGAYDWITGAQQPHDYQNDLRNWMSDALGPTVGEVIARGLPHLAGFDVHRRVGLSNLLEVPELTSFHDSGAVAKMIATAMTGAVGEDAQSAVGGAQQLLAGGDVVGAVKAMLPRIVRDPLKAYDLATRGVTDQRGRTVLPPSRLGAGDVAYQALGLQPSDVTEFREGRSAVIEARQEQQQSRTEALNAFVVRGYSALPSIRAYNQANPHAPITAAQLGAAIKRTRQQVARPGSFGLQIPRRSQELEAAGAFANH